MPGVEYLQPDGTDFDRFLYASVGEDRAGSSVTVVSALARLGLDPWKEAAKLSSLGRDAACARLGRSLSGFKDVPSLALEHAAVAATLTSLLPNRLSRRATKLTKPAIPKGPPIQARWVLAILIVFLVLARVYFLANGG
ncbi:hypothetical protein [Tropicimonas sediminicola]|uniref:Uncharacterized protein n=1 Tax=Tropicimonas sediminicola TaxID=1031541 RepID=A0A239MI47_9RHOB|nr:hypothetical protein [Tropicimonas sediminicola]SNT41774.1 hypothetical protein SAMN05421757_1202 [Tropicimonas sediminicola]